MGREGTLKRVVSNREREGMGREGKGKEGKGKPLK